jgi:hypothetical protein
MESFCATALIDLVVSHDYYKNAKSWDIDVWNVDYFQKDAVAVAFYLRDVLMWKMYVIKWSETTYVRCMRMISVNLFTDARHRSHHDVIFHNQWIGGGYSCAIEYSHVNNLIVDIMNLISLTLDDSRHSNLQVTKSNAPPGSKYTIDYDDSMLLEPPSLF